MKQQISDYDAYIVGKTRRIKPSGFEPSLPLNPHLFDWQAMVVKWALRRGKAALFEDCGLGKTFQQLEWARQVVAETSGKVLILCPLAVAAQTVREGIRFGIEVNHARKNEEVKPGINITNYDRLNLFDPEQFSGVVLDESSILKGFNSKMRKSLNEAFCKTPYKLACTATPSPNDFTELGQHAEFLGVCSPAEMLATYFINDTFDTGTWRIKKHAAEEFWRWVSSWAACISKPSDLGFSDEGYELPQVHTHHITVSVDNTDETGEALFRNAHASATAFHKE